MYFVCRSLGRSYKFGWIALYQRGQVMLHLIKNSVYDRSKRGVCLLENMAEVIKGELVT